MTEADRIDSEWIALNAFRELTKISTKGDGNKATYNNALELGGELYPELLGAESSILRRARESDTAKEYRQRAKLKSIKNRVDVDPVSLITEDIDELKDLIETSKINKSEKTRTDQLKNKLKILIEAKKELNPVAHSENQLIFRDSLSVTRKVPALRSGKAYRDFELPDGNTLRVRVLHPDKPEHITGADIIYEKHSPEKEIANIVAVQYKLWEEKALYLNDERMKEQISRLKKFACTSGICTNNSINTSYRFPFCAGFLRPTYKLQRSDQSFISSGEHLPICKIDECKTIGIRSAELLEYKKIRSISLSSELFESLFNAGKIGSRDLTYEELSNLYKKNQLSSEDDTLIIYAQEF
ncbi:hypothetical protein [Beijerinckia indica]|uniref:Uncharacterized protein n=1 Tax=Beijerinckia indica subsp. indica (strain ATCC 9039 / DSM 1715 / NCIMB 8712) TaxID=395963 RepID=B2IDL4_BEII9|nr:hypothetical protein [Beijerinckia indica]ACB95450.1 hypothetical protein Bind_1822 [Beijerinckia indica subsp. indica ATCC 9039]